MRVSLPALASVGTEKRDAPEKTAEWCCNKTAMTLDREEGRNPRRS